MFLGLQGRGLRGLCSFFSFNILINAREHTTRKHTWSGNVLIMRDLQCSVQSLISFEPVVAINIFKFRRWKDSFRVITRWMEMWIEIHNVNEVEWGGRLEGKGWWVCATVSLSIYNPCLYNQIRTPHAITHILRELESWILKKIQSLILI